MNVIKNIIPIRTDGARSGEKLTILNGVTIHNTDNSDAGADAITHGKLLAGTWLNKQQSWHYAVDKDNAVQSIPEDEVAWHAGDGRTSRGGNLSTIAIEICMNADGDFAKAVDNAARLTADILKRHGLPPTAVYQHHDWSGKNCPSQIRAGRPYGWDTFKDKVKDYYNGKASTTNPSKPSNTPNQSAKEKYTVGTLCCVQQLAKSSDGSRGVIKSHYQGYITKIIAGAKYPYLLDDGRGGWVNDAIIDADPHVPSAKKQRYEDPNGVIYVGDTVCFNRVFTVDDMDIPNNRVCCHVLIGGKPTMGYHWIDANPCVETNTSGKRAGDQIFYIGEHFVIPGDFKVLALDMATDASKIKIGNHETWVKTAYLSKVTYK